MSVVSKFFDTIPSIELSRGFGNQIQGRQLVTTFRVPPYFTKKDISSMVKKIIAKFHLRDIPSKPKVVITLRRLPSKKREVRIYLEYSYKFTYLCESIDFLLSNSKTVGFNLIDSDQHLKESLEILTKLYQDYLNQSRSVPKK